MCIVGLATHDQIVEDCAGEEMGAEGADATCLMSTVRDERSGHRACVMWIDGAFETGQWGCNVEKAERIRRMLLEDSKSVVYAWLWSRTRCEGGCISWAIIMVCDAVWSQER